MKALKIDSWQNVQRPTYVPKHGDDGSCGVFTLYMANYLDLGKTPEFGQDNATVFRHKVALFLVKGVLKSSQNLQSS